MKKFTTIIDEIHTLQQYIDEQSLKQLAQCVGQANHIFLAGAGRSGLMISAFANRLMHLGYSVSMVGEISSPHSKKDDLMIISSGSGETARLINQAKLAKANQVKIAVITTNKDSTLAQLADCVIAIPVNEVHSTQPMGSLYEQTSLLLCDSLVLALMAQNGETSQTMRARHADIE